MTWRSWPLLATFALIASCIVARTVNVASKPMANIEIESLVVAERLYAGPGPDAADRQVKPPGYPALLALLAAISPGMRTALDCRPDARRFCGKANFLPLFVLQTGLALATMALVFRLGTRLSGSPAIGLLALGLTFLMTEPGEQAGFVRADALLSFMAIAAVALAVEGTTGGEFLRPAASGAVAGLAVTVEPLLAILVATLACGLAATRWRSGRRDAGLAALAFTGSAMLVVATVLAAVIGTGYDTAALGYHLARQAAERLAYAGLSPSEIIAATLLPIPALGEAVRTILPQDQLRLLGVLGLYAPGALAYVGAMDLLPAAVAKTGSGWAAFGELLAEAARKAPRYAASLPPVLIRGALGGAGLLGLWGLFHVWRAGRYLHADGRLGGYAILTASTAGCLAANTLLSANLPAANPLVPVLFAVALASVARSI